MLVTHPYVKNVHVEELRTADGNLDRVLVVQSKKEKSWFSRSNNDNQMDDLMKQLQSLDTLAKNGFADFHRVGIREVQ
jgi:hypothetical protein